MTTKYEYYKSVFYSFAQEASWFYPVCTPCFPSKLLEGLIWSLYKLTVFRQDLFPPVVWEVVLLYLNAFFGHRNNVAAKLSAGKWRLHKSGRETAEWREGLAVRREHTTSPAHTTQHSHLREWNRRWLALYNEDSGTMFAVAQSASSWAS